MDIIARIIKLKPGSATVLNAWAKTMNERKDEALATLRDEGVEIESWFSFQLDGDDYLICYMRAASMQQAQAATAKSQHAIDAVHQQFKVDTWVRGAGAMGTLLLDLNASE